MLVILFFCLKKLFRLKCIYEIPNYIILSIKCNFSLYATELQIEVIGKTTRQNNIDLPNGKRYVSFKHEGGFKSTLAKYGSYFCEGSIYYNKK